MVKRHDRHVKGNEDHDRHVEHFVCGQVENHCLDFELQKEEKNALSECLESLKSSCHATVQWTLH